MFSLKFGNDIKKVRKIKDGEFSSFHRETISRVEFKDRCLLFPESNWSTALLGAGEEKAVFVVCDHENRVFALEAIDKRTYLNGRFVGGTYFFETNAPHMQNIKYSPSSLAGLTFTGLVKAREFVHGYEWARFQFSPRRQSMADTFMTAWLQALFATRFNEYRRQYKDVHDRNVMFEIRESHAKGVPVFIKDWHNTVRLVKVGVQPIDVR